MITTPTTFVIGAGASVDSGLPTGRQLLAYAQEAVHERRPVFDLVLARESQKIDTVLRVIDDLKSFGGGSIDDFLLARQDQADTQRITRALMAGYLGADISRRSLDAQGAPRIADWLQRIAQKMLDDTVNPAHFIAENSVKFVTFNFDSLIEDGLHALLPARFPKPFDQAALLDSVPVIHLHGRLPPPPDRALADHWSHIDKTWLDWLEVAADSVKVIVDPGDDAATAAAQEAVSSAEILCFLGFGFHRTSVARLGLPHKKSRQRIFASAYQEGAGRRDTFHERVHVRYKKENTRIGSDAQKCVDVLNDFAVFVD